MTPTETRIIFHEGLWKIAKGIVIIGLILGGLYFAGTLLIPYII